MACAPYPVALNVGNVTLENGRTARGIDVGIGAPQQHFAFIPNLGYNSTLVYDWNAYCQLGTVPACETYRGGQYFANDSATSVSALSSSSAGGQSESETGLETATWVQDTLALSSNTTLSAFPLAIPRQSIGDVFGPQAGLGLDLNSTLLTVMKDTGRIASRTWSYFFGRTGEGATSGSVSDGTLVHGGYDAAKTQSRNYTQSFTYGLACGTGLLVAITDLTILFANNTAVSLFEVTTPALRACIHPGASSLMSLPLTVFRKFEEVSGFSSDGQRSIWVNYNSKILPSSARFDGDLRITINGALDITVKNDQFVQSLESIDENGNLVASSTFDELLIISYPILPQDFTVGLGQQFLSAAMLMVNQDARSFTLWQAEPSADQRLIAIDPRGSPVNNSSCSATVGENGTSGTGPAATMVTVTSTPGPRPKALSGGAIAGIVVGGVILLSIIAGISIFLRRRRASRRIMLPAAEVELLDGRFAERATKSSMQDSSPYELPYAQHAYEVGHGAAHNELGDREAAELPAGR